MNPDLNLDFLLKIFILGVLPCLWQLLSIDVSRDAYNAKFSLFANFFASLFSLCIYLDLYNSFPVTYKLTSDIVLICILACAIIIYLLLYINWHDVNRGWYTEKVNHFFILKEIQNSPSKSATLDKELKKIKSNLSLYFAKLYIKTLIFIAIFCMVGFIFAKNTASQNYVTVRGKVLNKKVRALKVINVKLYTNDTLNAALFTKTDTEGNFSLTIPKASIDAIKTIAFYLHRDSTRRKFEGRFNTDTLNYIVSMR